MDLKKLKVLTQSLTILYVEDDSTVQKIVQDYLLKLFAKVITANNGFEGLNIYKKKMFDIVITDLSMPKMDGLEMISNIRKLNSEQPILITTAHTDVKNMTTAIKLGVDGYIIKPFDYEQLNYELYKISQKIQKFKENSEYQKHLQELVESKTSELRLLMESQKKNYEHTLLSLVNMIDKRDSYTAGHSQRVAKYCKLIAKEMGYSLAECLEVERAGILHDIGKIATPDVVLLKPTSLNTLEYTLIKEHVNVGYEVIKEIPMFSKLADIVRDHHERCDGSGYPRGIKAKEIHPLALVMMVADTFDAMTTNRIYKGRKPVNEALEEIRSLAPWQYDKIVVEAASRVLKDIKVSSVINQLPSTPVEQERFAYFYKDSLTNLYNKNYLDVLLNQNQYDNQYTLIYYIKLKNFSRYNQENGWNKGNEMLKGVATILDKAITPRMVFSVFGDDFIILDSGKCDVLHLKKKLQNITKESGIKFTIRAIELSEYPSLCADDLEKL